MITEILSTGDEISTGAIIDTNAAYIANTLEEKGIRIFRQNTVGDDFEELSTIFNEIGNRSDVCLVTGGLGPTEDDLTANAAAHAAGVELQSNNDARRSIENFFKKRNIHKSFSDNKQAMLPKGAVCIDNPVGTAPGFSLKIKKCTFFFMPGVPHEMRDMLAKKVLPMIDKLRGNDKSKYIAKTLSLFGLPEATVNDKLKGFEYDHPDIKLGFRAVFPIIQIKFYARGEILSELETSIKKAVSWTYDKMGDYIFTDKGESLETVVGHLLVEKKATLSVAESCTGGLIAHLLTNVPGSSDYFRFSGVTYSNDAKINILGVSPKTIEKFGAVHEETVKEMASGVRKISGTTYGLATSGIAGPSGGTEEKPVGTVCIGISSPETIDTYRFNYSFDKRLMNKKIFATLALEVLRKKLTGSK